MHDDPTSKACPSVDSLALYRQRRLEGSEQEKIAHHLAGCGDCRRLVDMAASTHEGTALFLTAGSSPTRHDASAPTRENHDQGSTAVWDHAGKPRGDLDLTQVQPSPSGSASGRTVIAGGLIGRYRVEKRLGSGSFGTVYLARDPDLDRLVAVKLAHRERIQKPEDVQQYIDEARALATLDHTHVLPVFDVGRDEDGSCYLVTKYVEGTDLSHLAVDFPLSQGESAALIARIAAGLEHAHQQGLVHRDIKPANILIANDGHPYLADFGLAVRDLGPDHGQTSPQAGTPQYMSPEQARGEGHRIDARSDLYSLGVVFYRLLTGRHPYKSDSVPGLLREIVQAEIPAPSAINPGVSPILERICRKMLEKLATDRYQTAADVVDDLRRWERGEAEGGEPSAAIMTPRGLRSFGPLDADAFLDLVPGPRDRDGLPESVAFWKRKVEATGDDAEPTFPVGLLLGSSGSGKSSLIAAGLIPRLARHVVPIVVDCARGQVESRLIAAIRAACPGLADELGLREILASVRRGGPGQGRRKILIVLDQFEQHLALGRDQSAGDLLDALRQCDGVRLQAILIARDDFALAAWRFFEGLEVPLLQGWNLGTVDRFSPDHARKVLTTFGRAYGRIDDSPTSDQVAFLDRAIADLTEADDVAPVRLAVFAEMVRDRPWNRGTLRAGGGVEGVGVAFLDSLFLATTANPRLKALARPARVLLQALLPVPGSTIRGASLPVEDLRQAVDDPAFDELRRILDTESRLITTIESEGVDAGPRLQLTHDYLVPSLRAWLTMKQGETSRGRAELRLAERASGWTLQPSSRQLPGLADLASILFWTRRARWSTSERKMMRSAVRHHGSRLLVAGLLVASLSALAVVGIRSQDTRRRDLEARGIVARLVDAVPARVPATLAELASRRRTIEPMLDQIYVEGEPSSRARRRAAIGQLESKPERAGFLAQEACRPDLDLAEALLLRSVLQGHERAVALPLWETVGKPDAEPSRRFRAALALAGLDRLSPRWAEHSHFVADQLLNSIAANPADYAVLVEALEPVRLALIPPLMEAVRSAPSDSRASAFSILSRYAGDDPASLVALLTDADPRRIGSLIPQLRRLGSKATEPLERVLAERLDPRKGEPVVAPPFANAHALAMLEASQGWVDAASAVCQSTPLGEFLALSDALRPLGFRPIRVRPYADGSTTRVAAIWTRDSREGRVEVDLSKEALAKRAADGFEAVDIASYLVNGSAGESVERFAVAWVRGEFNAPRRKLLFALDDRGFEEQATTLHAAQFIQLTHQVLDLKSGQGRRHAAIWVMTEDQSRLFQATRFTGFSTEYDGDLYPGLLEADVSLVRADEPLALLPRMRAELARVDAELKQNPTNPTLITRRASAHFRLGNDDQALADWSGLISQYRDHTWRWTPARLQLYARQGDMARARADLDDYLARGDKPGMKAYLTAFVRAYEGDAEGAVQTLTRQASEHPTDPAYLSSIANGLARIAERGFALNQAEARNHADRALDVLEQAVKAGLKVTTAVRDDPDFESINHHPRFRALMTQARFDLRYSALWRSEPTEESTEIHGLSPLDHAAKGRTLATQGYRPASIAVFRPSVEGEVVTASVWQRPRTSEVDRQSLADRQANAAVALLQLGRTEQVWPLLGFQPDPRLATSIQHRAAPSGVEPALLFDRLRVETDADARRVLILALGLFPPSKIPNDQFAPILEWLAKAFRLDPDAGVHSACEWALRRWNPDALADLQAALVANRVEPGSESRWYLSPSGETFSIIEPNTFLMGARPEEAGRSSLVYERLHRRKMPRRFAIATKEVTNRQLDRFLDSNPSWKQAQNEAKMYARKVSPTPDSPAINVSFRLAIAYCGWLSEEEGFEPKQQCFDEIDAAGAKPVTFRQGYLERTGYRLPTEAEWECAARAGTVTLRSYGWADALLPEYARFAGNSMGPNGSQKKTWAVGGLLPDRWGSFDMLGNVAEWTLSNLTIYPASEPGKAAFDAEMLGLRKESDALIARGGAYDFPVGDLRLSARFQVVPSFAGSEAGFRIVRTLP